MSAIGRWIEALETAVRLWGRGNVYSAMVAGIELEPEHGLEWEAGGADRAPGRRGPLQPRHHPDLFARLAGRRAHRSDFHARIRSYFETLNSGYQEIRKRHGLTVSEGFMCHRCAYMQLECDLDRSGLVAA